MMSDNSGKYDSCTPRKKVSPRERRNFEPVELHLSETSEHVCWTDNNGSPVAQMRLDLFKKYRDNAGRYSIDSQLNTNSKDDNASSSPGQSPK